MSGATEKSSISLLRMIPVPGTVIPEPYEVLIVMVIPTAPPRPSVTDRCAVPASSAGRPGRRSREFALGFNPLLAVPDRRPWVPYYGYGAGVVRLSLGDNSELGGTVTGGYVRWNFFTDATVTVGEDVWVQKGRLTPPVN